MKWKSAMEESGIFFFLMIRRPLRSTQGRSSAASDGYKRQPVVATDAGGIPEIVRHGDTGLLVDTGNAGQVAQACLLYTSPSPRDRTRSRMPSSA